MLGSNADLLHKLRHNVTDAALMAVPDGDPDLVSIPLFDDDIFFAAPAGSRYPNLLALASVCRMLKIGRGDAGTDAGIAA